MNDTVAINLEPIPKPSNPVTGYTIRCTYTFDPVQFKYTQTEKPIEFKGRQMEQFRLDSFWKQIYTNCEDFKMLRRYSRVSPISFNMGICLLLLGVVLLILGVLPIWGKEKQNKGMVIGAGIIVILSLVQFLIIKAIMKKYFKARLFPKYEEHITKAVYEHFEEEVHRGLHWRGGRNGFRCIEFWYSMEDKSVVSHLSMTQNTMMCTESADMLRTHADRSSLEMRNFFKDVDMETLRATTRREPTNRDSQEPPVSVIRLKPVETERDMSSIEVGKNETEASSTIQGYTDITATSATIKISAAQESDIVIPKKNSADSTGVKKLLGEIVHVANVASARMKGEAGYVSQQDEDVEKGL